MNDVAKYQHFFGHELYYIPYGEVKGRLVVSAATGGSANVLPPVTISGCCNISRKIRPKLPVSYLSGVRIVKLALFLFLIDRGVERTES
jgi:hypothetical protein